MQPQELDHIGYAYKQDMLFFFFKVYDDAYSCSAVQLQSMVVVKMSAPFVTVLKSISICILQQDSNRINVAFTITLNRKKKSF